MKTRHNGNSRNRGGTVVDVKLPIGFVVWMEGESQEAFLIVLFPVVHLLAEIQKQLSLLRRRIVGEAVDCAALWMCLLLYHRRRVRHLNQWVTVRKHIA